MKLRAEDLPRHLAGQLLPVYLLSGDEPLQLGEAADAVRRAARERGYDERELMHAEAGFDWQALTAACDALSLFAEKRVLDLRLPSGKPGDAGAKALTAYAERPAEDTVLLVTAGKLDKRQQQSKWFKALDKAGATLQVWPVPHAQLPRWIGQRMRAAGLEPTAEATQIIADRVEGNLLAAVQEVEKLRLLFGSGSVDADAVTQVVADSARYDLFEWVDTALAGDAARAARMCEGLRGEGQEPVLMVWALTREIRSLAIMAEAVAAGTPLDAAMQAQKVWSKRQGPVRAALTRHRSPRRWHAFLARAARIDRMIKGAEPGNAWDELLQLALLLAGVRLV